MSSQSVSIDTLLRTACENKASDLHLKVANYPYIRVDGELSSSLDTLAFPPKTCWTLLSAS